MEKREMLHEGKAKRARATDEPARAAQHFRGDATAVNARQRGTIGAKGIVNGAISGVLLREFEADGIRAHLVQRRSDREMPAMRLDTVPVALIVGDIVAGGTAKRPVLGEGPNLPSPTGEPSDEGGALGDGIRPGTCRFRDAKTFEKPYTDRFRRDLGGVEEAYPEVYRRVVP